MVVMKQDMPQNEMPHLVFLGLRYNPFPVTPDIDDFFISAKTDQIITEIVHGIESRKGFLVLTGEVGLGKTTISRKILGILNDKEISTALVFHSFFQGNELIRQINNDFGLEADSNTAEGTELEKLNLFLLQQNSQGKNCSIIIDDAQNLSYESLELIRLISNLETDREKLVQILLIGQPELLEKLNSKELRQLQSRIVIQHGVAPLSPDELQKYIHFKLESAGGSRFFIDKKSIKAVFKATAGNLRRVNILMDRCLYAAFARQSKTLNARMVQTANKDLISFSPKNNLSKYSKPALFAAISFLLIFAVLAALKFLPPSPLSPPAPPQPLSEASADFVQLQNLERVQTKNSSDIPVPKALVNFLKNYNLNEYDIRLWQAINNDTLQELAEEIQQQKGYQLVLLPAVPDFIESEFDLLQIKPGSDKAEMFIIFWKPKLEVENFYWGYEGAEIIQLQYLLNLQGYYSGIKDGVVGKQLMQSVLQFQKDNGLAVTGRPDSALLFILSKSGA